VNVAALTDASGGIPGASLTGRRRLRPVHLRVPRCRHPQHRGVRARLPRSEGRAPRAELPVDAEHPLGRERVISNNFDRKDKKLWTAVGDGELITGYTGYTAHDEAQFVADEIEALHRAGVAYRDIAVFYRTNAQTRALEEIFVRSALPYRVVGGTKFYERAEIKDAMAYLISVANRSTSSHSAAS
jgi:DNA helicase-2/ATP-dependent DNA helicase PcrA